MSARKLWVRVSQLPPESATVNLTRVVEPPQSGQQRGATVRYLEDIPKVGLRDAQRFINASGEEFDALTNAG